MANVQIYTKQTCPYCIRAKALLTNKGVAFQEFDMYNVSDADRQALAEKTNNYRTVPQIFINDTFIGGFDQLSALDREGKLDSLLAS